MDINSEKIAIITVPYITSSEHFALAKTSYESFGTEYHRIAVTNSIRNLEDLKLIKKWNQDVIHNDINNLSRGWNKGVRSAIEKGYKYFVIPNLDVIFKSNSIELCCEVLSKNPEYGMVSLNAINNFVDFSMIDNIDNNSVMPIRNNDQSFSGFMISKDCFETIGGFDEEFPSYYNDDSALYKMQLNRYQPMKVLGAYFYHYLQGTVKHDVGELRDNYNKILEDAKEEYIKMWGGLPKQEIFKSKYNK